MWDGHVYPTREEASQVARKYEQDGFETQLEGKGDRFHVFTRREAGEAPAQEPPS